jgi:hypothetical protein
VLWHWELKKVLYNSKNISIEMSQKSPCVGGVTANKSQREEREKMRGS